MITKNKVLSIFVLMTAILIVNSCSREYSDQKVTTENKVQSAAISNNNDLALAAATDPKTYKITSVTSLGGGKPADFTWEENGQKMSFAQFTKNKTVLLNFWATWCPPCRRELPDIVALDKQYSSNNKVVIIGIALDKGAYESVFGKVNSFSKVNGLTYRIFIDPSDKLAMSYGGISAVPTTYIIDKNGNIAETLVGMRSKAEFQSSIDRAMKN